jgi:hypothetical protein
MVRLSAKAKLFLEAALAHPRTAWLRNEVGSLGPDPWSQPLSPRAARVALDALRATEKHIRDRLGDPALGIDEEADLINDLAFIAAVQSDLQTSLMGSPISP